MIKTFISHASENHDFVNWLQVKLEKENLGLDIFVDDDSVCVGDGAQKIIDEVKKSIVFIPIFSPESVKKDFVLNEMRTALNSSTTHLFPIKYKCRDEDVPEDIRIKFSDFDKVEGKIWEDFSYEKEWQIHFENLRRAIFKKILELGLLKEKDRDFYQDCEHLDVIMNRKEPTTLEIKTVTEVYLKKDEYQKYFFSKLENINWLKYLKIYGFFKFNPKPIKSPDSPGDFTIPHWYVLDYLEKVSKQTEVNGEKTISQLLDIIRETSNFREENGEHIDNYRTWWYFVKILLNIPNDKIPLDIIQLIPIWLDSKFNVGLPDADIATKLLPKFLNSENPKDWEKAEIIVEIITAIKWVQLSEERKGLFGKDKEAETLLDNYWLLESFNKNAPKVGENCSEKIIFTIAERLKEIFRGEHPEYHLDIDYESKKYRITVKHFQDFEFHCSIGLIKEENLKSQNLKDQLFKVFKPEIEKLFDFEIKDCKEKKSFITSLKQEIKKDKRFENINSNLDTEISILHDAIFSDYSYIWFKSFFSETEITVHGTEETLTLILRDIILAKVRKDEDALKSISTKFLGNKYQYPLFKRIVFFVIGKEWNTYKEIFWEIIDIEDAELLFDNYYFKPEIYVLLENNINKFSLEEKEKIKRIIEKGPKRYVPKDKPEKYIAYWKQEWYSVLKTDGYFASLYVKQKEITQIKEEILFKQPEILIGSTVSPLTRKDILTMNNIELVNYLNIFKTKDEWRGPTVDGLSGMLQGAVQEKPGKFIEELTPFLNVGYLYIYNFLWGIKDAWVKKKSIDWGKLFEFIKQYIDREDFWQDEFKVVDDDMNANHKWVIGQIGELIQEGTKDDSWAFSEEHLNSAQVILFLILDNEKADEVEIKDAVNDTLNSHLGKTITALIYLALRIARIEIKKEVKREPKWSPEIKERYEKTLKTGIIEAYTLFGQYLANLYYLDKNWVKEKIKQICPEIDKGLWDVFMQGYLLGWRVYDDLYKMMKQHYLHAIEYDFKESHTNQRLVQHISLQYLNDKEVINDTEGLFWKLLDRWNASQIKEIIDFFWMQRDYLGENLENKPKVEKPPEFQKMKERIIEFWRWVYQNKFKGKEPKNLSEEDKKILSYLSKLTVFLSEIDSENSNWLIASARYVHLDFNSPFFIEYLDNLKNKDTSKYVGEIYLKILDGFTPDYDQKHIYSIVEFLYQSGEKENADKICNIYGSRGLYFLRDLYEKNQK
jgi:hypothetical protein